MTGRITRVSWSGNGRISVPGAERRIPFAASELIDMLFRDSLGKEVEFDVRTIDDELWAVSVKQIQEPG